MDTFFEQIVSIHKTKKTFVALFSIWTVVVLVSAFLIMAMTYLPRFATVFLLIIFGLFWGGYKLTALLSIEYEYILTNGDIDVDKIIARSNRKRILTISCADVERVGPYRPGVKPDGNFNKTFLFCNETDENAYYFVVRHKNMGMVLMIFAPDERMQGAIAKYLPRILGRDPFAKG